jgi:hypothetical protein
LQPLHRFVSHRTQGAQWMTLWHSLFWTDITEHIELLVVFSTHEFFVAGCAVETREFSGTLLPCRT